MQANNKSLFMEIERVGPHYYRNFLTIDGIEIHWTPAGVDFYRQHYNVLMNHPHNTANRNFIMQILKRIDVADQLYRMMQRHPNLNFNN